jgi:cytochrome c553
MKKVFVLSLILLVVAAFKSIDINDEPVNPQEVKTAIQKSITLLQPSDRMFLENAGTCHSCHHQDLTAISVFGAKKAGYNINDTIATESLNSILATLKSRKATSAENNDPVAIVMSGAFSLWALSENNYPANKSMHLLVKNLMQRQTAEGSWVSPNPRPPLEYYAFTATALVISAINNYAPESLKEDGRRRIEKAKLWMMKEVPETNEEKVFQLLGLGWAKGDPVFIQQQVKKLIAAQREDGGWSQLDSLSTDAYATGQSLYALQYSGMDVTDKVFQRGINYLLRTQHADGSWYIKSRSFPGVPFVETGFPVGGDQFISAAGSNWATMALLLAEK